MLDINEKQYEALLRTGTAKYDLRPYSKMGQHHLVNKIKELENEEIGKLLDYQFDDNKYPKVFLHFIDNFSIDNLSREHQEKLAIIMEWLNTQFNLERKHILEANELFEEPESISQEDIDTWENRLHKYVAGRPLKETIRFLNYGKELLKDRYKFHMLTCSRPYDCDINRAYDKYIDIVNALVIDGELQLEESQESKKSKPFDRIQWKGTQAQLAELFIELKNNGWIEDYSKTAIKNCFTKSNTIEQYFVPYEDDEGNPTYEKIYTTRYDAKFNRIQENLKK